MSLTTPMEIERTYKDISDNIEKLCGVPHIQSHKEHASSVYVVQKTARIASATLLLSDVMDTQSPLRVTLQKTAMRLVEDASMSVSDMRARTALHARLRTLSTLFDTARFAHLLAPNNIDIMQGEILALVEFMTETGWREGARSLTDTLLHIPLPGASYETEEYHGPQRTPQGHTPSSPRVHWRDPDSDMSLSTAPSRKDSDRARETPQRPAMQDAQKDRRATILTLLQKKDRITIKDVTALIRDVSDKTVQRELLGLVSQGVLIKEGERRWSTYRLA